MSVLTETYLFFLSLFFFFFWTLFPFGAVSSLVLAWNFTRRFFFFVFLTLPAAHGATNYRRRREEKNENGHVQRDISTDYACSSSAAFFFSFLPVYCPWLSVVLPLRTPTWLTRVNLTKKGESKKKKTWLLGCMHYCAVSFFFFLYSWFSAGLLSRKSAWRWISQPYCR